MKTTPWTVSCLAALMFSATACDTTAHREQQAIDEIHDGDAAACTEERSTIEKAVQAYVLLNPDMPVTEAAMVAGGFIHQTSTLMDVMANGTVVPAAGTVCS